MAKYDHKKIEQKWQNVWAKTGLNNTDLTSDEPKHYNLVMFPYPSGSHLHIGHGYSYAGADVYGRFMRAKGLNVFEPIGFDSFGLPAENFAIKNGLHPAISTENNIKHATEQLRSFGCMFDFEKTLNTSSPDYYKWTQWIFLKLYEQGLAYQKESPVNWCPKCLTVLANEQVINGICERCDTEVVQRSMNQWFFKITDYADRLDADLDKVDWPNPSKVKQRNWIGRSTGVEFEMQIKDSKEKIKVYTTRIDTVFGMTYVVLAPEHPLATMLAKNNSEIAKYLVQTQKKSDLERQEAKEKTGVAAGIFAVNPFTGEEVPVWIADYVIGSYGTGAVMAVPAHDERDYEFATKFNLLIKESIAPVIIKNDGEDAFRPKEEISERNAVVCVLKNGEKYLGAGWSVSDWRGFLIGGIEDGESAVDAGLREIIEETGYKNVKFVRELGGEIVSKFYQKAKNHNRVAHFTPLLFELENEEVIDVADHEKGLNHFKWLTIKEMDSHPNREDMKLIWSRVFGSIMFTGYGQLVNSGEFTGLTSEEAKEKMADWLEKKGIGGRKVNFRLRDWSFSRQRYWGAPIPIIYCDKCGVVPVPESDLPVELPEINDFRPKGTGKGPLASVESFVDTKCPKCGGVATRETDTMDTFVCSSFYFLRYPNVGDNENMFNPEITKKWLPVDMYVGGPEHVTMHLLYSRFVTKALFDAGLIKFDEPFMKLRHQGMILGPDGKKMSKSKGNVIVPNDIISEIGADAFRTYILFMGRFEDGGPWNPKGLTGVTKMLDRLWQFADSDFNEGREVLSVEKILAKTIKKVAEDIEGFRFNTAVSQLMIMTNEFSNHKNLTKGTLGKMAIVIAPFAPHLAEEIWEKLGNSESVHLQRWPEYDENLIQDELVTVAVQINGKVRGEVIVVPSATEDEVFSEAESNEKIKSYIEAGQIVKRIYIPGKLLSLVVKNDAV
jgi:leucyl-tRNA synthetase